MPEKKLTYLFLLFFPSLLWSQHTRQVEVGLNHRTVIEGRVTAIALKAEEFAGKSIQIIIAGEEKDLLLDPDAPEYTYFLSLKHPVSFGSVELKLDKEVKFKFFLINSGESPKIERSGDRITLQDCSFDLPSVPQSEWRAGLTPPHYTRLFTTVSHVVLHHAAGSNTNTDYTQVVRDIYVYHTEVNGWSDIGYNYLIAQDGTVYAGRDPDGGEQDNILGAHFCGSNNKTMGICLLGNYETTEPKEATLLSLVDILSFKLQKEDLDPFGTYPHAFGDLGAIIGHRDGCDTKCPGENVYQKLGQLRIETAKVLINCGELTPTLGFTYDKTTVKSGESIHFQNQSAGYEQYKWMFEGAETEETFWGSEGITIYTIPGTFDVTLIGYLGTTSDTLYVPDLISVEAIRELNFTYNKFKIDAGETVSFINQSRGYESYTWILEGANPATANWSNSGTTQYNLPGVYGISLIGFMAGSSDTLTISNIITVESDPIVYPNPTGPSGVISIAFTSEIKNIQIHSFSGKSLKLNPLSDGSFQIPGLSMGIYFISIETVSGSFARKLLVQ